MVRGGEGGGHLFTAWSKQGMENMGVGCGCVGGIPEIGEGRVVSYSRVGSRCL